MMQAVRSIHIHLLPEGGLTLLTIVLVVLKVLGYLDLGWIWVFSPLWIPLGLVAVVLVFAGIIWGLVSLWGWLNEKV